MGDGVSDLYSHNHPTKPARRFHNTHTTFEAIDGFYCFYHSKYTRLSQICPCRHRVICVERKHLPMNSNPLSFANNRVDPDHRRGRMSGAGKRETFSRDTSWCSSTSRTHGHLSAPGWLACAPDVKIPIQLPGWGITPALGQDGEHSNARRLFGEGFLLLSPNNFYSYKGLNLEGMTPRETGYNPSLRGGGGGKGKGCSSAGMHDGTIAIVFYIEYGRSNMVGTCRGSSQCQTLTSGDVRSGGGGEFLEDLRRQTTNHRLI